MQALPLRPWQFHQFISKPGSLRNIGPSAPHRSNRSIVDILSEQPSRRRRFDGVLMIQGPEHLCIDFRMANGEPDRDYRWAVR